MSNLGTAPLPREPYAGLPELPEFTLTSTDIQDGGTAPEWMCSALFGVAGGQDRSPQLSWSGFPEGTKSFVLTCFDPDAPVPSGFWHWTISNIPANVTSIDTGADAPAGALMHRNDAGVAGFLGAAPPAGHGPHRYSSPATWTAPSSGTISGSARAPCAPLRLPAPPGSTSSS